MRSMHMYTRILMFVCMLRHMNNTHAEIALNASIIRAKLNKKGSCNIISLEGMYFECIMYLDISLFGSLLNVYLINSEILYLSTI